MHKKSRSKIQAKNSGCHCFRCGYEWVTRLITKPRYCAFCSAPYWDKPKGQLKMGRPKKNSK